MLHGRATRIPEARFKNWNRCPARRLAVHYQIIHPRARRQNNNGVSKTDEIHRTQNSCGSVYSTCQHSTSIWKGWKCCWCRELALERWDRCRGVTSQWSLFLTQKLHPLKGWSAFASISYIWFERTGCILYVYMILYMTLYIDVDTDICFAEPSRRGYDNYRSHSISLCKSLTAVTHQKGFLARLESRQIPINLNHLIVHTL